MALAVSISAMASTAAQAAVTVSGDTFAVGSHAGQDCPITGPGNPGFSGCWITSSGTTGTQPTDPTASRVVAQIGLAGTTDISTFYTTISGSEFSLSLNTTTNVLSFLYNMGAGDPTLHYITIKQGDGYELFYDVAGFTSGTTYTFSLNSYFPNNPGVSHVTVYDGDPPPVPEPATWALMLLGFGGIGMALRRSRRTATLMQIA